jgi:hypothetical protein
MSDEELEAEAVDLESKQVCTAVFFLFVMIWLLETESRSALHCGRGLQPGGGRGDLQQRGGGFVDRNSI